ncbi:MAG TPA: hypothetical protein VFW83_01870 [Bryobacteraceae bacterium]|nr:hypothetical protein [Bryobacteraceae bacterium]
MSDPASLEFAAQQGRALITHDHATMPHYFLERLSAGKSNPRIFLVPQYAPLGEMIESLLLVWNASDAEEWRNRIVYLPIR